MTSLVNELAEVARQNPGAALRRKRSGKNQQEPHQRNHQSEPVGLTLTEHGA